MARGGRGGCGNRRGYVHGRSPGTGTEAGTFTFNIPGGRGILVAMTGPETSAPARTAGPEPELVEARLVADALAGDGDAFARLVRPHLPLLLRVAARAARDPGLAEDAVQETLEVAYRSLRRYSPGTNLRAFLAGIAVRRAHTLVRGEIRRRVREEASPSPEAPAEVADMAIAREQTGRVLAALDALPRKRRQAAILRLDAGMSYREIAQALDTTEGSARVLVHLALKALRAILEDDEGGTT
jgi:RNA polymerase sigma-70 factor (ECF subfamily)